jgi:hypothetical protein
MELVNITYNGPGVQEQTYLDQDVQLLTSNFINVQFGNTNDYIESFIYDITGQLLQSNYNALNYYPNLTADPQTNLYSSISLDPKSDLQKSGYNRGALNIQYNFLTNLFNSQFGKFYWIKEISNSRTEIKLASQTISDTNILAGFSQYQSYVAAKNYYTDFYLNFGNNELIIATNVAYTTDSEGSYLLIKLYENLPIDYDVKTQLWITNKVAESVSFNVDIQIESEEPASQNNLRGPNFKVKVEQKVGQTTPYYTYNSLLTSNVSSSFQQLMSYYQDKSVAINVDYTNFENFIHFSSAEERLNNFVYKLNLIESYNAQIYSNALFSGGSTSNQLASSSIGSLQTSITNLIEKFDPYEYYLYFSSGSYTWPKRTSAKPYVLYSVSSSQASNWLGTVNTVPTPTTSSLLYSASFYDYTNKDLLRNTAPQYLLDDDSNQPYLTFLDMIGQHFDNIWIYYKDVSNRFNATNNPETGVSLDLVADALRGLGTQLYTNTNVSDNVYYSLFGVNQDGTLLPPTGSEKITTYVTSSLQTLASDTIQKEIYKRIYHNLPYLLKTRGTQRGLKALLSTFGIPDDILTVNEFGGYPIASKDDIFGINNEKISIITGSLNVSLSSSLLSPETTIQYYSTDNRINIPDVEVGFSPANSINAFVTSSLGYFNIDQYIGDPGYAQSSSYAALDALRNTTFQFTTGSHSVWEYIRLIKYYNNSVFKMIKDFVPARSNVSTGIIVKSHILERNKYARHEPSSSFDNNLSQSIELLTITGSAANSISGSTAWSTDIITIAGVVPFSSSQGVEKYTGEFSGSTITVTNLNSFSKQYEISQNFTVLASGFVTQSLGALYQNITGSVRSKKYFDLDYTSNQSIPINYGIVTQSINNGQIAGFNNNAAFVNPNVPYAELQDTNYALQSFTIPRYYGSKTTSATYNTYTDGDDSYGKTAAIDKIKYQYAYLVDMYSSSFQLPGRVNAQIKYILDNNQNVLNLTKQNNNIFTSQNVFKSGENTNISLFDYAPDNNMAQYLTNNQNVNLYEGGYRYSPILFNVAGTTALSYYDLDSPVATTNTVNTPLYTTITTGDPNYFPKVESSGSLKPGIGNPSYYFLDVTASGVTPGPSNLSVTMNYTIFNKALDPFNPYYSYSTNLIIPSGTPTAGYKYDQLIPPTYYTAGWDLTTPKYYFSCSVNSESTYNPSGGTTTTTSYSSSLIDKDSRWIVSQSISGDHVIKLSNTQSLYYEAFIFNSAYSGLETPTSKFSLSQMDLVRLYNLTSSWGLGSYNQSEYRINSVYYGTSDPLGTFPVDSGGNSYYFVSLDRNIDPAQTDLGRIPGFISKYIVLKRSPDETNLILAFSGSSNVISDGLIFPKYIDPIARENSGNVVKSLKQQNLI